jgi:hypothetical protein
VILHCDLVPFGSNLKVILASGSLSRRALKLGTFLFHRNYSCF